MSLKHKSKRSIRAQIYWDFKNPVINPLDICKKFNITIDQLQDTVDSFHQEMFKPVINRHIIKSK